MSQTCSIKIAKVRELGARLMKPRIPYVFASTATEAAPEGQARLLLFVITITITHGPLCACLYARGVHYRQKSAKPGKVQPVIRFGVIFLRQIQKSREKTRRRGNIRWCGTCLCQNPRMTPTNAPVLKVQYVRTDNNDHTQQHFFCFSFSFFLV